MQICADDGQNVVGWDTYRLRDQPKEVNEVGEVARYKDTMRVKKNERN
jgi:hypothetical protein